MSRHRRQPPKRTVSARSGTGRQPRASNSLVAGAASPLVAAITGNGAQQRQAFVPCEVCETPLPVDARFCHRCGRPQDEPETGPVVLLDDACELAWWHGYVRACFFVVPDQATTVIETPLVTSASFRWLDHRLPPPTGLPAEVHRRFVRELRAEGWEPVGQGPAWFQQRFRLRAPVQQVKGSNRAAPPEPHATTSPFG